MYPTLQLGNLIDETIRRFIADIAAAVPRLLSGVLFLALAVGVVRLVLWGIRKALSRAPIGDSPVYRQFVMAIISVFLWFGVALSFLSVVGLDDLAVSLGTATGFLALGVSYALSGMIADAVAGVYLLRDPDFNIGDSVTVGDMTGTVEAIELRKTRFDVDGDTVIRGNADIEKRWTRRAEPA